MKKKIWGLFFVATLLLLVGCGNKDTKEKIESSANSSGQSEKFIFRKDDLVLQDSNKVKGDFSNDNEINKVFESIADFPVFSKDTIIENTERITNSINEPKSLDLQIKMTKEMLGALQTDFNNKLKELPNDDERYEALKDYFKNSYSFLNSSLSIAENYKEKRIMSKEQEKKVSQISNNMDVSFSKLENIFKLKGTPLKDPVDTSTVLTKGTAETTSYSDSSNYNKIKKDYSVQFLKDRLAFEDFSVDPFTAKIEIVDNAPVLIFDFDWYNQSFPKTTTFLSAGSLDAFQGDTLLEQLDTTEGNMVREVAVGSAATVEVKFKLLNTEQPIKINFVDNQSGGQEVKSVTLTLESK